MFNATQWQQAQRTLLACRCYQASDLSSTCSISRWIMPPMGDSNSGELEFHPRVFTHRDAAVGTAAANSRVSPFQR